MRKADNRTDKQEKNSNLQFHIFALMLATFGGWKECGEDNKKIFMGQEEGYGDKLPVKFGRWLAHWF